MKGKLVLLVVFLSVSAAQTQNSRNPDVKKLTDNAIRLLKGNERLIPGFIRMAFHDCVGGCDGCVDTINNPGNIGLDDKLAAARKFRKGFAPLFSQADVNVFLAKTALEYASGNKVIIPFTTGRRDCSLPLPNNPLPNGDELDGLSVLMREFRLTTEEAVALLGAHSLGMAQTNQSGFEGQWDNSPYKLDVDYYKHMQRDGCFHERKRNSRIDSTQWTNRLNGRFHLMLHADMILLKRFTVIDRVDTPSCTYAACPDADTAGLVRTYSNNRDLWLRNMESAFTKMINR